MTRVVILAGGTGGAKLAQGLQTVLPAGDLTVIANTGDDVERHGLLVMPDHDAVLYMLGGRFDHERGWGIADETWTVMDGLKAYGEEGWFGLGDRDFATHIARSARIRRGESVTDAVLALQAAIGLPSRILPMTDEPVRTQVQTDEGWLEFQEYFVHRHQAPEISAVRFDGIASAGPTAAVLGALADADLIVIGPSNPIVSLGPILALPGLAEAIGAARARSVTVMTVSGIVGGRALKGPADRMLASLGHDSSAAGVATLLAPHTDLFVMDTVDGASEEAIAALGLRTHVTDTIMADDAGRARLAADLLAVADGGGGAS